MQKKLAFILRLLLFLVLLSWAPRLVSVIFLSGKSELAIDSFLWSLPAALLFLWPAIFFKSRLAVLILSAGPAFLLSFFDLVHLSIYGTLPVFSVFYAIFETNQTEAVEYLWDYVGLSQILALLLYFLTSFMTARWTYYGEDGLKFQKHSWTHRQVALSLIGIPLILLLAFSGNTRKLQKIGLDTFLSAPLATFAYFKEVRRLMRFNSQKTTLDWEVSAKDKTPKVTHIVIFGESLARAHMGIYGYFRPTTPLIETLQSELYIFKNAQSPHARTQDSILKMITFSNLDNKAQHPWVFVSIFDLLKRLEFKTFWISNQISSLATGATANGLIDEADEKTSLNLGKLSENYYDESVIDPLNRYLDDPAPKKFIGVHLLGNHNRYSQRYPETFDKFSGRVGDKPEFASNIINKYDNSVLYGDKVLFDIIQLVKQRRENTTLIFVSDHGEEVFQRMKIVGHNEAAPSRNMFEIPFMVWLSPEYKTNSPELESELSNSLKNRFITDDLIHFLHDLYGFSTPYYESARSWIKPDFKERDAGDYYEMID